MKTIKNIPLPITGLILGLAALGNLVASHSMDARWTFGYISMFLFVVVTLKILMDLKAFKNDLEHPVVGSVFPTYTMAMMVLSTYVLKFDASIAKYLYLAGIVLHLVLVLKFSLDFLLNFNIKKVFPSYFIVYVGVVVGSVCAPAHNMKDIGQLLFWLGLVGYICILPVVIHRVVKVKEIPTQALPTLIIFSAPASLLLAGYNASFADKIDLIQLPLLALSLGFYIYALIKLVSLLRLSFYPSYSAFTFPLVISAIAIKTTKVSFFDFSTVANIQTIIALILVTYVLVRYTIHIIKN